MQPVLLLLTVTMNKQCRTEARGHDELSKIVRVRAGTEVIKETVHGFDPVISYPHQEFRKRLMSYRAPAVNRGPPRTAQAKSVSGPRPKGH